MNICVTSNSFSKHPVLQSELRALFPHARFNTSGVLKGTDLVAFFADCKAAIVGLETVDDALLAACPTLKIVAKFGVGLDNIDQEACARRNIAVGWTGGVNKTSVAEMALGFMLTLSRNLFTTSLQLKAGTWNKSGGYQLSGKTVGIIGVGHIGKELVRLLSPFGCTLLLNDVLDIGMYAQSVGARVASKQEIFSSCDLISVHTPLTETTENLVCRETLSLMKPSAFVINTARGPIVNQADLQWALEHKIIAGAALDVYPEEPPNNPALLNLPNLFCTPHIGGNANEAVLAMGRSAIGHIKAFAKL